MNAAQGTERVINEAVRRRPDQRVGAAVHDYRGYRQHGVAPAHHRGLPSPFLTLIFTIDEPLEIARHVDRRRPAAVYDTLAGGLHTTPVVIAHHGAQSGIMLLVDPLGARGLFGLPAGELAGHDGTAGDVLGSVADEVYDSLRATTSWDERFAVLDRCLGRVIDRRSDQVAGPPAAIVHAWRLLLHSGGLMPVGTLADAVGYSERHLASKFRAEVGLTPKVAGRVIRFDRARRALQAQSPGAIRIADVAAHCGYYDQAPLVRDFVEFTGWAPTRWLAEECRNVQAAERFQGPGSTS